MKKNRFLLSTLVFIILNLAYCDKSYAQLNLDSIRKIWNSKSLPDTIMLDSIYNLIRHHIGGPLPDDTLKTFEKEMYNLALKTGSKKYQARSLLLEGNLSPVKDGFEKSISLYNQCIKLAEEIGDNEIQAAAYSKLAIIAYRVDDKKNFLLYQKRCVNFWQKTDKQRDIAWSLHNLGYAYQEIGYYDSAVDYYNRSLVLSERLGSQDTRANCLAYLGETYQLMGEYAKAQDYFKQSLKVKADNNITNEVDWTMVKMGEGFIAVKSFQKAADICQKAYDMTVAAHDSNDAMGLSCKCLYNSFKALGKINDALLYYERWNNLNDKLKKTETNKLLQQVDFSKQILLDSLKQAEEKRMVIETNKREIDKKNQQRNIFIAIGCFILLLALILWNRLRFVRKSRAEIAMERDRSNNLLLNILPDEVAQELKDTGTSKAKSFQEVTVMFTDFKGFTMISEKLSPEELVEEIDTCFKAFDNIIHKHGIEKIKTIGDAYMCAGGLPVANKTHAEDTVKAAIEIRDFMDQHNKEKIDKGELPFEIRIGINTGPVVAGIVGVKKFAYDIWGDTVNLASRMESSGKEGEVNISGSTYELVKDKFTCSHRGKIQTKNKGEVDMYFVN
jgi:adenylate cyclase